MRPTKKSRAVSNSEGTETALVWRAASQAKALLLARLDMRDHGGVTALKAKVRAVLLGWAVAAGSPNIEAAQVDCETIPAGPARTDCYIGLSRITRQKSDIAATAARQQVDAAKLGALTGTTPKETPEKKRRAAAAR